MSYPANLVIDPPAVTTEGWSYHELFNEMMVGGPLPALSIERNFSNPLERHFVLHVASEESIFHIDDLGTAGISDTVTKGRVTRQRTTSDLLQFARLWAENIRLRNENAELRRSTTELHRSKGSLRSTLERIRQFAELGPNWDSYGGDPPTAVAIAQSCLLILGVVETVGRRAHPWTSAPTPDGGIQVEWKSASRRIEVQVGPDGSMSYLTINETADGVKYDEADGLSLETISARIVDIISS